VPLYIYLSSCVWDCLEILSIKEISSSGKNAEERKVTWDLIYLPKSSAVAVKGEAGEQRE
jgi:hypothetical protein